MDTYKKLDKDNLEITSKRNISKSSLLREKEDLTFRLQDTKAKLKDIEDKLKLFNQEE